MVEVQCPRCEQYWYSEEEGGRIRLCSRCAEELRRQQAGSPVRIDAFFITTLALFLGDVLLIVLAVAFPAVFGRFLLWYGVILTLPGLAWLRIATWGRVDPTDSRWLLVIGLAGLACVMAFFSFIGFHPGK